MDLDDLILISKKEPVVKNGLLLEGQVAYNLGLNEIIGPQKKVVYNAMGPDVSTVLYLTDADEIIGIEKEKFRTRKFLGLIKNNFDNIEIEIGREDCINPIIRFNSQNEAKVRYLSCLESRKNWGYWDYGSIDLWGRERLMVFELKSLGLNQRDINITDEGNKLVLEFEWKHPLSEKKLRRIEYNHSSTMKSTKIPKINCFYQKSLENYNLNIVYSSLIKDKIDENGCAFFGYWHSETEDKNNSLLREEYKNILGKSFNEIPEIELANLIEKLKIIGHYGNRLHCFKRI